MTSYNGSLYNVDITEGFKLEMIFQASIISQLVIYFTTNCIKSFNILKLGVLQEVVAE
jgi:hypothetical protein